jgi:photosystem II stability/assembly factor-like uncharacterized protein
VDSGTTWTPRLTDQEWTGVASSADGTKLVASGELLYTSNDSGTTWTQQTVGYRVSSLVSASSADGSHLAALGWQRGARGGNIFTSSDGGRSWTESSVATSGYVYMASSADGTKLIGVVTYGDVYASVDSGMTWKQRGLGADALAYSALDKWSSEGWVGVASSADGTKLVLLTSGGRMFRSSGPTP